MSKFNLTLGIFIFLVGTIKSFGQQVRPELSKHTLQEVNRSISFLKDSQYGNVVHVEPRPYAGVVWVKEKRFASGTIEFDVKGKDTLQRSFVGVAFHGKDNENYEVIYFRPFNFQAADPVRKKHAVQYIALPQYDWPYLRETFPDQYEAPLRNYMDPNGWFHVKITVGDGYIRVFVNGGKEPILLVKSLLQLNGTQIGFWTGHESGGDFANLVFTSK